MPVCLVNYLPSGNAPDYRRILFGTAFATVVSCLMLKRLFDILVSVVMLMVMVLPILLIAVVVRLSSSGTAIYWSERVGRNNNLFQMPKFRTMRINAPVVATHLMPDPKMYITPIGRYLRRTSLDELPQLWSVLIGDMSLVGPRPALFNQDDLIVLRTEAGVDKMTPGLTGLAQINGRDELSIPEKVKLDVEYMRRQSFWFDLKIIYLTIVRVIHSKGVSH